MSPILAAKIQMWFGSLGLLFHTVLCGYCLGVGNGLQVMANICLGLANLNIVLMGQRKLAAYRNCKSFAS
jgi:hypothetical protein